ncbi:MAG: TIGR00730 family Rossman fold protein [Proteobacteria bacterium]|nr:TIGR00730 family Rossman fold protein [Pseudomonadota bacterium]
MTRICVFCGSSPGSRPDYLEAAKQVGHALVSRGLELVYGGANVGLMGALADAVLEQGGRVTGIIPEALVTKEVAHPGLTELRIVQSMHQRKAQMEELSAGFIALPGGFGTLEEIFEVLTWAQLGIHPKPCGLLNIAGYYDHLLAFLAHSTSQRFVSQAHAGMLLVEGDPDALLDVFENYVPPTSDKLLDRSQN